MIYQWQRNLHASVQGNLLQGCKPWRAVYKSYDRNHAAVSWASDLQIAETEPFTLDAAKEGPLPAPDTALRSPP